MKTAVIDIGTNTLLLLIAEPASNGGLRSVLDLCRFGRLGQGLDATGRLADEAIARSLDICREYRAAMDAAGVERHDVGGQVTEVQPPQGLPPALADLYGVAAPAEGVLRDFEE